MRDNTQREGNGRLAYGNQIYKRNMPTSSDMGDSRLKVKLYAYAKRTHEHFRRNESALAES
jgi:hypothetical protein